jgi:hypothetical protein
MAASASAASANAVTSNDSARGRAMVLPTTSFERLDGNGHLALPPMHDLVPEPVVNNPVRDGSLDDPLPERVFAKTRQFRLVAASLQS